MCKLSRVSRWYSKKEYKNAKQQKVFSLTTSNGYSTTFLVLKHDWAQKACCHSLCNFKNIHLGSQVIRKHSAQERSLETGLLVSLLLNSVPKLYNSDLFAAKIKTQIGPFLKRCFPQKRFFKIILDSEHLMHAPPSKAAMKRFKIAVLPDWPTPYYMHVSFWPHTHSNFWKAHA